MEDNNVKELLQNFEKASSQLDQALETIKAFSEKLNDYSNVSENALKAIEKVASIEFDTIEKATNQIQEDVSNLSVVMSDLQKTVEDHTTAVKAGIYSINQFDIEKIETLTKSNESIENEIKEIREELQTLNENIKRISQKEEIEENDNIEERYEDSTNKIDLDAPDDNDHVLVGI